MHLSESVLARIQIIVRTTPGAIPAYDVHEIEARLAAAARRWDDELKDALDRSAAAKRAGNELFRAFARRVSGGLSRRRSPRAPRCPTSR